ncbi:hypothetical protein FACS189411_07170 [Bacteroidia bacterium]|nr:hypothetical protein FACS189411_07170 [Bacteroidia bacterium]
MKYAMLAVCMLGLLAGCNRNVLPDVQMADLLAEMTSVEEGAHYPAKTYTAMGVSGRTSPVLFDKRGPGVITRIRLAADDSRGRLRFYFDGSATPEIELSAYDLSLLELPDTTRGLFAANTLYLPLPYNKSCRITFEEEAGAEPTDKYYQIDYRKYPEGTMVETFTFNSLSRLKKKIAETSRQLLHPDSLRKPETQITGERLLEKGDPVLIKLPQGGHAVYELRIRVMPVNGSYEQAMRDLTLQGVFDGKQTIRVPLSDFSGGGMGAPAVRSYYIQADGKGGIVSRWLMPYKEVASLAFINEGRNTIHVSYTISASTLVWDERMLYFHVSWNEETGLRLYNRSDSIADKSWTFAAIKGGRGVYKGEVLTVYNHTTGWFGEGDETIRVDNAPSYEAAGISQYYSLLKLPPAVFQSPFGGVTRADLKSSYGYNTLFRVRHLDAIPFTHELVINMDVAGRKAGRVDYATTIFWYGDVKARSEKTSRPDVYSRQLLPAPTTDAIEPLD